MNTLYFLAIPLAVVAVVGLVMFIATYRPKRDEVDESIGVFHSELGALSPDGRPRQVRDPIRPTGHQKRDALNPDLPVDVLLAEEAEQRLGLNRE